MMQHTVPTLAMKDKFGRLLGERSAIDNAPQSLGYRQRIVKYAKRVEHHPKLTRNKSFANILGKARAYNHLLGNV